jgi:chitin deacetylase
VIWNQDPQDWRIDNKTYFESDARAKIQSYVNGTKTPGLLMLEHELFVESADAFIQEYPTFAEKGWETNNIVRVLWFVSLVLVRAQG